MQMMGWQVTVDRTGAVQTGSKICRAASQGERILPGLELAMLKGLSLRCMWQVGDGS